MCNGGIKSILTYIDKIATVNFHCDPKNFKTPRKDLVAAIMSRSPDRGKRTFIIVANQCKAVQSPTLHAINRQMME